MARKAVNYLKSTGIADTCFIGPEAEFFIFDDVRYDFNQHEGYYHLDSVEGEWNRGRDEKPNLGYKIRYKEGYFPVPPADALMNIRNEMMQTMIDCGIDIEAQHHEVATAGQSEIDMRFQRAGAHGRSGDDLQVHHQERGQEVQQDRSRSCPSRCLPITAPACTPTFRCGKVALPLFAGSGYAGLSEMAMHAIGGLLKHAPSILGVLQPDHQQLQATWCRATKRR